METARKGSFVVIKLEHGEDILSSLETITKKEEGTLFVTTGLGMISDFELGYFDRDGAKYVSKSFEDAHELLSMQGSVATSGQPRIHIHVTVADREHNASGGHLLRGKVWMSNEIVLARLDDLRSTRAVDQVRKVGVLHFEDRT